MQQFLQSRVYEMTIRSYNRHLNTIRHHFLHTEWLQRATDILHQSRELVQEKMDIP